MTKQYDNYADLITFTRGSSGTYLDSDGLLKTATTNVPRIEYDAEGNRLGLLIEEARTNLLVQSEDFGTDAGWSWTRATVTENAIAAPDGTTTADYLEQASGQTGAGSVARSLTISGSGDYTWSVFAKAAEKTFTRLQLTPSNYAYFNLSTGVTGTAVGCTASITDCGSGWYRCSITASLSANPFALFYVGDTDNSLSVTDSGGIYLWGGMFEASSFATSYIKTSGATATRSADVASIPTSAFGYNQKAGTVVVDSQHAGYGGFDHAIFSLSDLTINEEVYLAVAPDPDDAVFYVRNNNTTQASYPWNAQWPANTYAKFAVAFSKDDVEFAKDGTAVGLDTSATMPIGLTALRMGQRANNAFKGAIYLKSIQYYPRRLTNAQLQELTA